MGRGTQVKSDQLYYRKIDIPSISPNAMDDEFDGSVLSNKWTLLNKYPNQTASLANGFLLMECPTGEQYRPFSAVQSTPSGTWSVATKIAIESLSWSFFGAGLIARKSSNDKRIWCGLLAHSTYGVWTGYVLRSTGEALSSEVDLANMLQQEFYLKCTYDGTNLIWSISITGAKFREMHREAVSSFLTGAPDQVGVSIHPYDSTGAGWGGLASFDWFRRLS